MACSETSQGPDVVGENSVDPSGLDQKSPLSDSMRAKIERNRQKALLLKQSRLARHPYKSAADDKQTRVKEKLPAKLIDTGGGFLLEDDGDLEEKTQPKIVHPKGAILAPDYTPCEECAKPFVESFLLEKFDVAVCNSCRDNDEKHKLITKTEAKNTYLLKDSDFDRREPPLKFIIKKNPRNDRWGDMKLYLASQVLQRAIEVWESLAKIEEKKEELAESREKVKQKRYDKKVKNLRLAVRSSLWKKDMGPHEHIFGNEEYDEEEDVYTKTCTSCGHKVSFEKM